MTGTVREEGGRKGEVVVSAVQAVNRFASFSFGETVGMEIPVSTFTRELRQGEEETEATSAGMVSAVWRASFPDLYFLTYTPG